MRSALAIVLAAVAVARAQQADPPGGFGAAANWPQWRGPTSTGISTEKGFPTQWGGKDRTNVLWEAELPENDDSQSSPIVWGDRVYVTTSLQENHRVTCYAARPVKGGTADGKRLWDTPVPKGPWKKTDTRGGWGAPTPCTDGQRIFALFGTAILAALNCSDGKIVWSRPLDHTHFDVAMGSSPILHGDTVIVYSGLTERDSNLTAFDKASGEVKWKLALPKVGFGHCTPAFATVDGQLQLIVSAHQRETGILGVDPTTGRLLWSAPGDGETSSPAIGSGMVYCDSGRGGGGYALELAETKGKTEVPLKWKLDRVRPELSSPIIVGNHLYRLGAGGVLTCRALATGEEVYAQKLLGAHSWVSPVATADGLIYLASSGKSHVVRAGSTLTIVATSELPDPNHASPAFSDGMIFLKGRKHLYCIARRAPQAQEKPAPAPLRHAERQWAAISDGVVKQLEQQGRKPAWPGKTTGVAVDRTTGDVFMIVCGLGVWRSGDRGATFARVDGGAVGGRCETGYALRVDPKGRRLACFMLDGKSAMTLDGGKTWRPIKNVARGYDWAAVDWSQPEPKTVFARVHELGGLGVISQDGGKSWKELGKDFGPVGLFSDRILVASKGDERKWRGIVRSTDGGSTWQKVSDASPIGAMTVWDGVGYWLSDQGLLRSKDKGQTWERVGKLSGAVWGPYFGKDAGHFAVVSRKGFHETPDGGKSWRSIARYPPSLKGEFNTHGWMMNFAWDPLGKVCYAARMGQPTCKCDY